jgi:RecA/RadA recombinase
VRQRGAAKLRLAMIGPAGSGKTFSALSIAASLAPGGGRVAVIDTERGSASKYADQFDFDVMTLERHSPTDSVQAIKEADAAGFGVLVIDSLNGYVAAMPQEKQLMLQLEAPSQQPT